MPGIVLHSNTSTTHATNLAESLSFQAIELPYGQPSFPDLQNTDIAVLILEPNFLKKEIENDPFLDEILSKSLEEDFHLVPVLLAECAWEESIYSGLAFLPADKVPVLSHTDVGKHLRVMEAFSRQIKEIEHNMYLKKEKPHAYLRHQKKLAKKEKGSSFWVVATRLGWKLLPPGVRWLVRIGLGGIVAAITYLLFG